MTTPFHFKVGHVPLLISMPHVGTLLPPVIAATMDPIAQQKSDTDWHLPLLYNMAEQLGASIITAKYSRYVIDLNRPVEDSNLYPGQDTTGLCPVDTFAKQPLYPKGYILNKEQIASRVESYWQPYHQQLSAELERLKELHGKVVLWDAHSIASVVPRFFEGRLPDFNFGTADDKSCAPELQLCLKQTISNSSNGGFSHVFNGRFKGGYITRHYGQPGKNIHAVQLEMSQRIYMDERSPYDYLPDRAAEVQPLLHELLTACIDWAKKKE